MRSALVAGGGIGGLAAGIALLKAGFKVTVLERASELREVGAGILIWPNGTRALDKLGVPSLPESGLDRMTLRTWRGGRLSDTPVGQFRQRYGAELKVVSRPHLHGLLEETLGRDRLATGAEVAGFSQAAGQVEVSLRDGRQLVADLLVGADGLRSAVRRQLLADGDPSYVGCTGWRGMTDATGAGLQSGQGLNWWGPGGEFGVLPMGPLAYWFGTANEPAGQAVAPGERRQDLLRRFGTWPAPIADLIARTEPEAILRNDIYDRPPADHWTVGRVTLLGDAAHPMAPNAGQGACQALEDAVGLGAALTGGADIEGGLREYERRRLPRANGFVRLSRQVSAAVQTESAITGFIRNLAIRALPRPLLLRQMDRTMLGG